MNDDWSYFLNCLNEQIPRNKEHCIEYRELVKQRDHILQQMTRLELYRIPKITIKTDTIMEPLDKVNVRRLMLQIQDELEQQFVFEPNDDLTRSQVRDLIQQTLDCSITYAIDAYEVICDTSNNSPESIDQGCLNVDIVGFLNEPIKLGIKPSQSYALDLSEVQPAYIVAYEQAMAVVG